ncbi:MAG: glutathione-disulfide reductase [Alphaproteobacteria bacterium]
MSQYDYDLFVIGGGSGGVRAARFSAGMGARVAIAEERYWGGTCVNVGCVPKKLFSYASHFAEEFRDSAGFGWKVGSASFDWPTLRDNKTKEIERLNGIYDKMLGGAGCEMFWGTAKVVDPHTVELEGKTYTAANILVAVGGWPFVPDMPGKEHIISSNEAFYLDKLPREIVIVGGGYIAVEFAGIFHGLGVEVTQLYRGSMFLRGFDKDVREHLAQEMGRKGIDVRFNTDLEKVEKKGERLIGHLKGGGTIEADAIMYATGRRPSTGGIGLEEAGVEMNDNGTIPVDQHFRTNVPSILALGDVLGRIELTPVALAEGMAVARTLFGNKPSTVDYAYVPSAVFSHPPIGSVGLTEEQGREALGDDLDIYLSDFKPLKNTLSGNEERTLMKLVVQHSSDRVVGVHMVGPEAGEMMQGIAIALKAGATKAVFDSTIGIHPTSAEEFVTMREVKRSYAREAAE